MKTNFELEENYAVQLNGTHIDLHNNFDFLGLSKSGKNISIDFKRTNGDWVKSDELKRQEVYLTEKYDLELILMDYRQNWRQQELEVVL